MYRKQTLNPSKFKIKYPLICKSSSTKRNYSLYAIILMTKTQSLIPLDNGLHQPFAKLHLLPPNSPKLIMHIMLEICAIRCFMAMDY